MKKQFLKLEQNDDLNTQGAPGASQQGTPPPAANAEAAGDSEYDEYGYKIVKPTTPEKQPEVKADDKKTEAEAAAGFTGYGKDEPVDPPATPPAAAAPAEVKLEFELDAKNLPAEEVTELKQFILETKLPKEQAQALIDFRKKEFDRYTAELAQIEKENKEKRAQQRASWDKELREDPVFGGANFALSVSQSEKVVSTLMPETKKVLTEGKVKLPPYVMRDLKNIYKYLYPADKLVQGDPVKVDPPPVERSPLDFYNQKKQ